jgi:hypothetical protein
VKCCVLDLSWSNGVPDRTLQRLSVVFRTCPGLMVCVGQDSTALKCCVQELSWSNGVCRTGLYSGEVNAEGQPQGFGTYRSELPFFEE